MKWTSAVALITLPLLRVVLADTTTATDDQQSALTLDARVIATGFANDGQADAPAGQTASDTSSNNFINFCLTAPALPLTNGQQLETGSCNPAPMGVIAGFANMPSAKFVSPANFDTGLQPNTPFAVTLALAQLHAGAFTNAETNFLAAPQTVDAAGDVVGHTHIVIEALEALNQTTPTDPTRFAFFKGVDTPAAADGTVTIQVAAGLPAGVYRMSTINTAANHQPVLVAVAQHGWLDDQIYFTVGGGGTDAVGEDSAAQAAASSLAAVSSSSTAPPVSAMPSVSTPVSSAVALQNGQAALVQNAQNAGARAGDTCAPGAPPSCAGDQFAQCVQSTLFVMDCAPATVCRAVPLVDAPGTSIVCIGADDANARIKATGASARRRRHHAFGAHRRS